MSKRNLLIGAGALAALALVIWYARRPKATTAAPTPLLVGTAGIVPVIDDLSNGELYSGTAKAIV